MASGTDTYSGTLADGGSAAFALTKIGAGTLTLGGSSANTYTGATTLTGGYLRMVKSSGAAIPGNVYFEGTENTYLCIDASEQIANTAVLYFNNTSNYGRFCLDGYTETVAGINTSNGRGVIQNVQSASGVSNNGTLIVNNAVNCFYDGYLRDKSSGTSTGIVSLV